MTRFSYQKVVPLEDAPPHFQIWMANIHRANIAHRVTAIFKGPVRVEHDPETCEACQD